MVGAGALVSGFLAGSFWVNAQWDREKLAQTEQLAAAQAKAMEDSRRRAVAHRKADEAYEKRIRSISGQLADALVSLRNRPERGSELPESPGGCVAGSGAGLAGGDAEFLARYAAAAAEQQAQLQRCIGAYEAQRAQ